MKKKLGILAVLMVNFYSFTFSQEITKDSIYFNRISLNYNPSLSYRILSTDNSISAEILKSNLDSIEQVDFGFSTGLNYRRIVGKHVGLNLGMNYSVFREKTRNGSIDQFTNYQTTNSFISFPLQLILNSNFYKKTNYFFQVGIAQNILVSQNQSFYNSLKNENSEVTTNYDLKKNLTMWNAAFGVNFRLNTHFSFTAELLYNSSFGSINNSGSLKKNIYSLGPNFHLGYSF